MKAIKCIIAALIIVVVSAVSFCLGRNYEEKYYGEKSEYFKNIKKEHQKHYEAACLQSDFIRYLIDHFDKETECYNIGAEIEESYYEFFDGLELGLFNTHNIKSVKDFNDYSWCY